MASLLLLLLLSSGPAGPSLEHGLDYRIEEIASAKRLPAERLRLARTALREATRWAKPITDTSTWSPLNVYNVWTSLEPDNAPAVAEWFFQELKRSAFEAERDWQYTSASSFAAEILARFGETHPEQVWSEIAAWPEPSPELGSRCRTAHADFQRRVAIFYLRRLAEKGRGEEALELLRDLNLKPDYQVRASVARSLLHGNRDRAREQASRILSDFRSSAVDRTGFFDLIVALGEIRPMFPDLFAEGFRAAAERKDALEMEPEDPEIQAKDPVLSYPERLLAGLLTKLPPSEASEMLQLVPSIRAAADQVGGLQLAIRATRSSVAGPETEPESSFSPDSAPERKLLEGDEKALQHPSSSQERRRVAIQYASELARIDFQEASRFVSERVDDRDKAHVWLAVARVLAGR